MSRKKKRRGSTADFPYGQWPFLDGELSKDAEDAARYRWLRESNFSLFGSLELSGKDLDATIDAAMKK